MSKLAIFILAVIGFFIYRFYRAESFKKCILQVEMSIKQKAQNYALSGYKDEAEEYMKHAENIQAASSVLYGKKHSQKYDRSIDLSLSKFFSQDEMYSLRIIEAWKHYQAMGYLMEQYNKKTLR